MLVFMKFVPTISAITLLLSFLEDYTIAGELKASDF